MGLPALSRLHSTDAQSPVPISGHADPIHFPKLLCIFSCFFVSAFKSCCSNKNPPLSPVFPRTGNIPHAFPSKEHIHCPMDTILLLLTHDHVLPSPGGVYVNVLSIKWGKFYKGLSRYNEMMHGDPLAQAWHVNYRCPYCNCGKLSLNGCHIGRLGAPQGIHPLCIYCTLFLYHAHAQDWVHSMNKTQVISVPLSSVAWQRMCTWEGCQVSQWRRSRQGILRATW